MAVHSKDGTTWLTKLKRIGELSATKSDLRFNNLGHLISADMLKEQYRRLDWKKAVGIDGVSKRAYGKRLNENIASLIRRIRRGAYKPRPARLTEIPKEDGSTRPLAISCIEDKIVQLAVSTILSEIYEPLFLPCSFGFRPGKSCHDALRALTAAVFPNVNGAIVEIDIRKYFNTIPHEALMKLLRNKISDRRFLKLIETLITAPIMDGKQVAENVQGCPQGSIISPILANIYLHHVIDEWFAEISKTHLRGRAQVIRYADDMVFTFENPTEAQRFYRVLPKRFAKFGLTLHEGKSQLIPAGNYAAQRAARRGERIPAFRFLGFTCYWGKVRSNFWRLKFKSRRDRFASKLRGLRNYLWENLNTHDPRYVLQTAMAVIRGWINYHHISDNGRVVDAFRAECMRTIFRWFNRRGRRKPLRWDRFNRMMQGMGFPKMGRTISMFPKH